MSWLRNHPVPSSGPELVLEQRIALMTWFAQPITTDVGVGPESQTQVSLWLGFGRPTSGFNRVWAQRSGGVYAKSQAADEIAAVAAANAVRSFDARPLLTRTVQLGQAAAAAAAPWNRVQQAGPPGLLRL